MIFAAKFTFFGENIGHLHILNAQGLLPLLQTTKSPDKSWVHHGLILVIFSSEVNISELIDYGNLRLGKANSPFK